MLAGVSRGMKKTEIRVTTLLSRTQSKLWNLSLKEKKTSVDNFNPKTKETNKPMKKLDWLIGAVIFIAFLAVIGNIEVFLEEKFPNPYDLKSDE